MRLDWRVSLRQGVLATTGATACLALVPAAGAQAQSPLRLITDDFSSDRLASDYVVHAGGPMKVDDGVLRATTVTPDKVITHNASAGLVDSEVTLRVNFKANASAGTTAAIVKFLGPGDYLRMGTTYSSSSIKVTKWDNGERSDLFVVDGSFTLSPNTSYWVRARIQGNFATAELWGSDPLLGGAPIVSHGYALTGADAAKFGAGVAGRAGIYLDPSETRREFDDLHIAEIAAPASPPLPAQPPPPAAAAPRPPASPAGGACRKRAQGTAGRDTLIGTAGGDLISGLAGDDSVRTLAGDDCAFGAAGSDRLYGGDDDDLLRGGSGGDRLRGDGGDDRLRGDRGDDLLVLHAGDDRAWGGSGADRIFAGIGADVVQGGSGSDLLDAGNGDDRVYGGGGRDTVSAGAGRDRVDVAGGGRDSVSCGSGRDVVRADRRDRVSTNCERVIRVR